MGKSRKQAEQKVQEIQEQGPGNGLPRQVATAELSSGGDQYPIGVDDHQVAGAVTSANHDEGGATPVVSKLGAATQPTIGSPIRQEPEAVPLSLVVPLSTGKPTGYIAPVVHVRLTSDQSRILKRLHAALHAGHYRRANGQHVDKTGHAIQWMLDQLSDLSESLSVPAGQVPDLVSDPQRMNMPTVAIGSTSPQ